MREAHAVDDGPARPSPVDVLAQVAVALHGPSGLDEKLAWAAEAIRRVTAAGIGAYVGAGSDRFRITTAVGVPIYEVDTLARPAVERVRATRGSAILRAGDLRLDRRWRMFLERASLPSSAAALAVEVPAADGPAHGWLIVAHRDSDHFVGADEAAAQALAVHVGVAVDNESLRALLAEEHRVQQDVVHQLQEAVRPPVPTVAAAELGVFYLPADETAPTGGDLHDWLVLPDGDVFLSVVDIMGKGVAATKEAVAVTHALRMLALDGCPMDRIVARADALLTAHNPDLIATVIVARYRPSDGRLWLAGGGQPPALFITARGDVRLVTAPGVALGWPGAGSTEVVEAALDRNDTLVLYTDGLIESTKDVIAGLDNLTKAAAQIAKYPSANVAKALVERSLAGAMRRDDSLALVLRRRTPPPIDAAVPLAPFEYRFSPTPVTIPLGRHLLSDWLEHLSVDESERADLLLVASELCSNAVRHASGAPSSLALRAWTEDDAIIVEAEDDGAGFQLEERYDDEEPDTSLERGRGLYVVQALSDEVSVRRVDDRTVVRAVRRAVLPTGNGARMR